MTNRNWLIDAARVDVDFVDSDRSGRLMWRPDQETFAALVSTDEPGHAARWYGSKLGQYPTVAALVHKLADDRLVVPSSAHKAIVAMGAETGLRQGETMFVGSHRLGREAQIHIVTPSLRARELTAEGIGWGTQSNESVEAANVLLTRAWGRQPAGDRGTSVDLAREVLAGLPAEWSMPARGLSRWVSTGQVPEVLRASDALEAVRASRNEPVIDLRTETPVWDLA